MATLRIQNGPLAGQTFEVLGELVIGREAAGVVLEDARVSRRHAVVRELRGVLEVEDLGSTNGTFVDGKRLEGRRTIGDGAQIMVGSTVLEVLSSLPLDVTRRRPVADPESTRLASPGADRDVAGLGVARPERAPARPANPKPMLQPEPVSAGVASTPVGEFSPPAMRRSRGLASRSWVPVALSFGSVILTAIALIVYFAAR